MTRSLFVAAMAGGVALAVALPAAAAGSPTATTFTLTGGSLSVAAPTSAALGSYSSGTTSVHGFLGNQTVTDARGGTASWTLSGISSAFTGPGTATTSSSTMVQYGSGVVATTGTVTAGGGGWWTMNATTPVAVMNGTGVSGNNSITDQPELIITMPASALAGSYSGTVTVSVA